MERRVGLLKSIHLYPVKSMRGLAVAEARAYWYGLNGDRKYAFLRPDARTGFPWLTGRDLPALLGYQPLFLEPNDHHASPVAVTTPTGETLPLESPALLEEIRQRYGGEVSLTKVKRGSFDCMPTSLLTTRTLAALQAKLSHAPNPQRFRSNLILEADIREEDWLDKTLLIGETLRLSVNYPIPRCLMVNLEPTTGANDPRYLKAVAHGGKAEAGVYASVAALGRLRVGDEVWLLD